MSGDNALKVWELESGVLVATFHGDAPARCCAWVDYRRIVAGKLLGQLCYPR